VDYPLIVVVGPTGSGKSALGLRLARMFSGEIVNCDSLQLYRGFDIGSAKTPAAERMGVPHHLLDVLEPDSVYSAGDYAREARAALTGIRRRGRLPLVVGGTGFYLRALLEGLPALPPREPALRERLTQREAARPGSLYRLLRRLEPAAAARIHPQDTQKLVRALEVRLLTRESIPGPATADRLSGYRLLEVGLAPDREQLASAIAARTRLMFAQGLVEEVRGLLAKGLTGREKPFEALGYRQTLQNVCGEISLEDAIVSTEIETRQYAKRQMTWFRRDPRIRWIRGFGYEPGTVEQAAAWVRQHLAA
jgi:tRNA dimethylallyltransferase